MNRLIYRSAFYGLFFIILFTAACSGQKVGLSEIQSTEITNLTQSYPSPTKKTDLPDIGYPMNTPVEIAEPTSGPLIVPTPGSDSGVIIGILLDEADNTAIANQTIFLGDVIYPSVGSGFSIGIDQSKSPTTVTNQDGEFAIGSVPPGEYVIMVWTPVMSSAVLDPGTNEPMVIVIMANQTFDIGSLKVANPLRNP